MATSISFRSGNKLQTIIFDAATAIRPMFKSELTKHPIEKGSDVTDGTRKNPDSVTVDAVITDYPLKLDGKGIGADHEKGRASDILDLLILLKNTGVRVKLETALRGYANMRIESIAPNSDRLKGAIKLAIVFSESQVVDSETVDVEVAKNKIGQKETDLGKKTGTEASEKEKSASFLHKGVNSDAAKKAGAAIKKIVGSVFN